MNGIRCEKWRYRTELDAKIALADIKRRDRSWRAKIEKRAYRCPKCGGWHLTSKGVGT